MEVLVTWGYEFPIATGGANLPAWVLHILVFPLKAETTRDDGILDRLQQNLVSPEFSKHVSFSAPRVCLYFAGIISCWAHGCGGGGGKGGGKEIVEVAEVDCEPRMEAVSGDISSGLGLTGAWVCFKTPRRSLRVGRGYSVKSRLS